MSLDVDQIYLSMRNPGTGEYLTANVYTVDGVYEADGVTPRLLSIGQVVMALCLQRAAMLEEEVIKRMNSIEDTSTQLELMTQIENAVLDDDVNMSSKKVNYKGSSYSYHQFLTEIMDMENVPTGIVNADSSDFLTALESKMDENNSFSQKTMIELQSYTNKRDQSYDMISNVLKSINTVLVSTVNNM